MNEEELLEGLAAMLRDMIHDDEWSTDIAAASIAYICQHDGHAAFVRRVRDHESGRPSDD